MADSLENDLMEAMAAALEESENENLGSNSGHSSMKSVDVMGEAINLLNFGEDGDLNGEFSEMDDDEGEIDFDNFLTPSTATAGKTTNETSESPTSVVEADQNEPSSKATPENDQNTTQSKVEDGSSSENGAKKPATSKLPEGTSLFVEQPQVVPLKQFENALALIQDLENRIQVLETDQQCLLEENEQLRETTNKQATVIADMEAKLERFPKLLEQTVQEEAKVAAAKAEAETKVSFWRKDMERQEQEQREEKRNKNRVGRHSATTSSLKQADFLQDVVDRKDQEHLSPGVGNNSKKGNNNPNGGPVALFRALRNSLNRGNNNNNNNRDGSKKGLLDSSELKANGDADDNVGNMGHRPTMEFDIGDDDDDEDGIRDNGSDSNVLDLMT